MKKPLNARFLGHLKKRLLKTFVRSIASPARLTVFARTQRIHFFLCDYNFLWDKFCAFVRAIAKRLILTFATSAPIIGA